MNQPPIDQHELIERVLCDAGGVPVETKVPADYAGKRADVLFEVDNIIVEIKSLTSDRPNDPQVAIKLGDVFLQNASLGGPIPLGEMRVRLHDLPVFLAERLLRVVGKRVRAEVAAAAKQVQATRDALKIPDAFGLVVFVSPPDRIGHASMAWLINDMISQSENRRGLDGALVIETSFGLAIAPASTRNSFSAFSSISGRTLPAGFGERIADAWERTSGQRACSTDSEMFTMLGASE